MTPKDFFSEFRKRKIFKGFSIYAIASWVIIQVAATTFPYLDIPKSAVTFIIILVLIGLPLSLVFSWYYNIIPDEKEDEEGNLVAVDEEQTIAELEFKRKSSRFFKFFIGTISVLILIIVFLLFNQIFNSNDSNIQPLTQVEDKIAVLEFNNNTGNPEFDVVGKAISDWLAHGIVENQLGRVISSQVIEGYTGVLQASVSNQNEVLNKFLIPKTIITGNIFIDRENLIFKCLINDGKTNETLFALSDIKTPSDSPLEGIERLQAKVLGNLATEEAPELKLQDEPPIYSAYTRMLKAKTLNITDEETLTLLNEALKIDSNYFEAKVYRIAHYYNVGEIEKCDSLLKQIKPSSKTNFRQKNLIEFYNALLQGKNKVVYETWKNEYNYAPFSLIDNSTMMTITMQYVNKPFEVGGIFKEIDMTPMNISICDYCIYRLYIMARAHNALSNYRATIALLQPHITTNTDLLILKPLISAYVATENSRSLNKLFDDLPGMMTDEKWKSLYLHTAKNYSLLHKNKEAMNYYDQAFKYFEDKNDTSNVAYTLFLSGEIEDAKQWYEKLNARPENSVANKSRLSICYYLTGEKEKGVKLENEIALDKVASFGEPDYHLAVINAHQGNKEKALNHLLSAVKQGFVYRGDYFSDDPAFKDLQSDPEFIKILNYWH